MKKFYPLLLIFWFIITCISTSFAQKVSITGIDPSLKPGDDFFMYVNAKWYNSTEIPSTQSGVGAYSFMNYPQRIRLQGILDSVSAAKSLKGSIEQKVGDFYASGMDTITIDKRGFEPVKPMLKQIDGIKDVVGIMKYVADQQKFNNYSIIGFRVGPDIKNSAFNIVNLGQTGIGYPKETIILEPILRRYLFRKLIKII